MAKNNKQKLEEKLNSLSPDERKEFEKDLAIKREEKRLKLFEPLWASKIYQDVKKKIEKKRNGRPYIITLQTLESLYIAFLNDCSDEEACAYAKISTAAFYNFQNRHKEFIEYKEAWKLDVVFNAKITLRSNIGDPNVSMWLLSRHKKTKQDYSQDTGIANTTNILGVPANQKEAEALAKMLQIIETNAKQRLDTISGTSKTSVTKSNNTN